MRINIQSCVIAAAVAASSVCLLAQPIVAGAATTSAAPVARVNSAAASIKAGPGTCTVEISTVAFTPLEAYDGSGGNILFSGSKPSEAKCDQEANMQYQQALNTGWSPTNRCAIISQTGYSDEIFTEITYIWNNNPSVRSDGYAVMCHHAFNVQAPAY
jgi:hypothetical protein